jgi:hypothetical protein
MTHEELEALTKATTGLAGETSERVSRLQDFCNTNNATINRNFRNVGEDINVLSNRIKSVDDCQNAMLILTLGYFGLKLLRTSGLDKKIKDKFFKKKEEAPKEEEEDDIDEIIDDTL